MKSEIVLYLILFFGVFSLSTSAIFVRLANAPSAITAFFRLFFAALFLLPFLLSGREGRHQLKNLSKRQWLLGILSGLLLSSHYMLWFESLKYTSVASSTVIVTLQPLFSIAIGRFILKERYHKLAIGGCFVAVLGCFLIGWGDLQINLQALLGDLMAFIAAGFISVYFFLGQAMRKDLSAVPYSAVSYFSSSLFLACYALLLQNPFAGYSAATWLAFLGLALISTICGQFIFNWLLKWLPVTVISMSILGETIGTCILAYFILNEKLTLQQGVGIVVIFLGLAMFFLSPKQINEG